MNRINFCADYQKVLKFLFKTSSYKNELSLELKITFGYLSKIISELQKAKLITVIPFDKRRKNINLTEKGKKIAIKLIELDNLLK